MKLIAIVSLILGLALPAAARSPRMQVDTQEFAVEVCTSTTITLPVAGIDVVVNSVSLSSATYLEVYNVDTATAAVCGFDTNVSINKDNPAYGREALPRIGLGYQANWDKVFLFCKPCSAGATTRATITKCR